MSGPDPIIGLMRIARPLARVALIFGPPEYFARICTGLLLPLNLPLIGIWAKLLKIPYRILFPPILLLCRIGAKIRPIAFPEFANRTRRLESCG